MGHTNIKVIILKILVSKDKKIFSNFIFYLFSFLVILALILQLVFKEYHNALICALTLVLILLPMFVQRKIKLIIPNGLLLLFYLVVYAAGILGEVYNFYIYFRWWDIVLHTLSGFLIASLGLSLFSLNTLKTVNIKPLLVSLFVLCFSMTISTMWEFNEYGIDKVFKTDYQKDTYVNTISSVNFDKSKNGKPVVIKDVSKTIMYDKKGRELAVIEAGYLDIGLNDTMGDLLVNFIGAFLYAYLTYQYLKKHKPNIASKLIITRS